jgi:hypothetical protein
VETGNPEADKLFKEDPVTVTWSNRTDNTGIYSYSADVSVYSMNSRKDTDLKLNRKYRLSLKSINSKNYVRMDFESGTMDVNCRSLVSDGNEIVFFNPDTEEISKRFFISGKDEKQPASTSLSGLSRIDIESIKSAAKRLSFDITENKEEGLVISYPVSLLDFGEHAKPVSQKIRYDTTQDTIAETESCMILDDGTTVTTSEYPVYEDSEGVPVKVGCVSIIQSDVPGKVTGFDDDYQQYASPDDIPTLSDNELKELQNQGTVFEAQPPVFGDPSDLSSTKTVVEKYDDVEINNTSDTVFRMLF